MRGACSLGGGDFLPCADWVDQARVWSLRRVPSIAALGLLKEKAETGLPWASGRAGGGGLDGRVGDTVGSPQGSDSGKEVCVGVSVVCGEVHEQRLSSWSMCGVFLCVY